MRERRENPPEWDGMLESAGTDFDDELLFEDQLDKEYGGEEKEGPSWGLIVGSLVAVAAIAFLIFDGMQTETFFFDADVAAERSADLVGHNIRVRGTVEPGSVIARPGSIENQFRISESGVSVTILFNRGLPDTFQEDSEIVAQGSFDEAGVFHASEVLVKCPSRYEGAPPTAGGQASEPQASR